jgi:iron-sulfur cluster assembly protein
MSTTPTTTDSHAAPATPVGRQRARVPAEGEGVHLTPKAAEQIREIVAKGDYPQSMYLFLGVKGGGCSGLQYVLDLRSEADIPINDTDEVFLSQDIVIVSDLRGFMVGNLAGTVVDFQDGLMGRGFTVNNPNAKHSCGCGSSYSA